MLAPLRNQTYRRLFAAQIVSLIGTGLATVALGLLAYALAGENAGLVLGSALAIKMIAYVGVSPVANALLANLPRRSVLIALDIWRAAIVLMLPLVSEIWHVFALIFLLQSASAAFTPTFQATIPDILPDEDSYTEALSLSRLAYDLESLISPALAAALLTVMTFNWLFALTAVGFLASALLVYWVTLPCPKKAERRVGLYQRTTLGIRAYLATPRLRGLLAINLAVAAAGAMVIVNTVVYVRSTLRADASDVALALAIFGLGSMLAALALPRLLRHVLDRTVMLVAATGMVGALSALAVHDLVQGPTWVAFGASWFAIGVFYSAALTPAGRLLRRSSHAEDRPAFFAAQFALSHACWLMTYPLAGWLATSFGMVAALLTLATVAFIGVLVGVRVWPAQDDDIIVHHHHDLPADHPHLAVSSETASGHAHAYVIDALHPKWPDRASNAE